MQQRRPNEKYRRDEPVESIGKGDGFQWDPERQLGVLSMCPGDRGLGLWIADGSPRDTLWKTEEVSSAKAGQGEDFYRSSVDNWYCSGANSASEVLFDNDRFSATARCRPFRAGAMASTSSWAMLSEKRSQGVAPCNLAPTRIGHGTSPDRSCRTGGLGGNSRVQSFVAVGGLGPTELLDGPIESLDQRRSWHVGTEFSDPSDRMGGKGSFGVSVSAATMVGGWIGVFAEKVPDKMACLSRRSGA